MASQGAGELDGRCLAVTRAAFPDRERDDWVEEECRRLRLIQPCEVRPSGHFDDCLWRGQRAHEGVTLRTMTGFVPGHQRRPQVRQFDHSARSK